MKIAVAGTGYVGLSMVPLYRRMTEWAGCLAGQGCGDFVWRGNQNCKSRRT